MSKKSRSKSVRKDEASGVPLRKLLRLSLRRLESAVNEVSETYRSSGSAKRKRRTEAVHALRIETRRSGAMVDVMSSLLDPESTDDATKRLKRLRSAGGLVRDCDVQRKLLGELAVGCSVGEQAIIEAVRESIDAERQNAWRVLAKTTRAYKKDSLKRRHKRLAASLDVSALPGGTVEGLARSAVLRLKAEVEQAAARDLRTIECVHSLRIACKRLRYGIEGVARWLKDVDTQPCLTHLADVQAELGRFNDSYQMLCRVEAFATAAVQRQESEVESHESESLLGRSAESGAPDSTTQDHGIADLVTLQSLVTRLRLRVEQDQETAVGTWRSAVERGLLSGLMPVETVQAPANQPQRETPPASMGDRAEETRASHPSEFPAAETVIAQSQASQSGAMSSGRERTSSRGTRIAAIDIGSNSTRLIIAEVHSGGGRGSQSSNGWDAHVSYRVLDDERELTRLGKGLDATGNLDPETMQHAAFTIKRMKGIADGYGVERFRVVATAAVREARNGAAFTELVQKETGLQVEVISADEEAMLSYRSAARAFDLGASPAIVVDVGGGSTEVVLSVPAAMRGQTQISASMQHDAATTRHESSRENGEQSYGVVDASSELGGDGNAGGGGGVIERVYKIPLGAVRLTERFGGPEVCSKSRFDEMRRAIKRQFTQTVGQPPVVPLVLIGTGGTFSSLGSMCACGELGPAASGLFAGAVQGFEVKRPQVMHLLDLLRKLPVKERGKVPGLSSDRADIIVAGLALIDRLMKYFGVNQIRVHDGGVRDGVLLAMAMEIQAANSAGKPVRRDPLRSVKRFARACGYEQAHSKQVAKLCLRVFDQLAREFHDADQAKNARREPTGASASRGDEASAAVVAAASGAVRQASTGEPPPPQPPRVSKRARLFTPENRILLEAAALLHDVGYLINYSSHHKHSYHLIMHADLPGFTRRDVAVIANVGRYHRLSEPKMNHHNFAQLAKPDRRLVRVLAGILRVCDGLDRTHTQCVEGIDVIVDRRRRRAVLGIRSEAEPSVDIWGAQRKSGLFAKSLKLEPVLEWRSLKQSGAEPQSGIAVVIPATLRSKSVAV